METNDNINRPEHDDYEINLENVLKFFVTVFGIIFVFALIWAQWKLLQCCASIVFVCGVVLAFVPDKYLH